jgi:aspartyl protease family protein
MGYVRVKGFIAHPLKRSQGIEVEFIVDTGAIYTVIPKNIAEKLDLKETDKRRFRLASGEVVEYPVSEAYIRVKDRGVTSLIVIGSNNIPPILGVTTLELLGFQVDPVTGELKPLELMIL